MRNYIIGRALLIIPTVLGVTLLMTWLLTLLPGSAADIILAESATFNDELTRESIEADLGLNKFFVVRWAEWLGNAVQGDFGETFRGGKPIGEELLNRAPVTLQLAAMALALSLVIAIPIGVLSAIRQDSMVDYVARSSAIFMLAMPGFFLAVLFLILAGNWVPSLLPPIIYEDVWDDPESNLRQLWAPAVILAFAIAGGVMRLTRGQMLEVLRQDYVRTAWSKGLRERTIIFRHAMKNAFIPVITLIGVQVPILVSGTVVLESIFGIPGLGLMLLDGLTQREYLSVLAVNVLIATIIVVINFVVDITYSYLDPRIRYS